MMSATVVAESYAAAFRLRASLTRLVLNGHRDVACANIMCARVGGGCACRLAQALERLPGLRELELARNALPQLPAAVWRLERLERLDASGNALEDLALASEEPPTAAAAPRGSTAMQSHPPSQAPPALPALVEVDLRDNRLRLAALAPLIRDLGSAAGAGRFPRLERVRLAGNAGLARELAAAALPARAAAVLRLS